MLGVLGLAMFLYLNFHTVQVQGESMENTYTSGSRLLATHAYWLVGQLGDGDVVVVRDPRDPKSYVIKRLYRMPGEKVDWQNVPRDWKLTSGEYRVPMGMIYVLGDNREFSEDSRTYGPVEIDQVLGKVVNLR